jgi:RNA polymerase sigma factor (sigma-70 family)
MATSAISELLQRLRGTAVPGDGAGTTDGELLERFVTARDQAAFAALVQRHAPMVWGVCRRLLPRHHDAEDAFQATFLVLVRKAASVVPRALVANWLYGVAHRTALNARAAAAGRGMRERQVTPMPEPAEREQHLWRDLQPLLDEELSRLPTKYRVVLVLCDLEGKTRKDAAHQLGVPEGTLSGRLSRGRALLARRLARHGVAVSGGILAAVLSENLLSAGTVPTVVMGRVIHTASLLAAGHAVTGVVPAKVAALTEGVIRTMLLMKLRITGTLLILAAASLGAAGLIYHTRASEPAQASFEAAPGQADERPTAGKAPRPEATRVATGRGQKKLNFTIGKETTYISGPLASDGAIDYETALNERIGKGVTPESNANVLLWQALAPRPKHTRMPPGFFDWLKAPEPPERGACFIELPWYAQEVFKLGGEQLDELLKQRGRAAQRPWVAKDYPQVAAWLKANERPLATVLAATERPNYYNPLVSRKEGDEGWYGLLGAPLPAAVECYREVAPALAARALLRAGDGRFDEAWRDLLACHRLGRLLARGADHDELVLGLYITEVAAAAEVALLERANPTAQQAQAWLRDLERLPPAPRVADKVDLGLRFKFLNAVMMVRRGPIRTLRLLEYLSTGRLLPFTGAPEPPDSALNSLDCDSILRAGNRWYDRVVAALRLQDRAEREKAFAQLEEELQALKQDAGSLATVRDTLGGGGEYSVEVSKKLAVVVIDSFMPAIRHVKRVADRIEQVERNLHLAFALAAYRAEHGRYPEKLSALAPRYLAAVPTDLFSGQTLLYRPSDKGYLLYSVGANGVDEEGRGADDTPRGDDLVIRVPLPELKRD